MHLRWIAVSLATAAITTLGGAQTHASASSASPDINPVSCASSFTWVKLYSSAGQHCYTGNGTTAVNLVQVHEMQVLGRHTVCLTLVPLQRDCFVGASSKPIIFSPPIDVRLLSVATP